MVKRGTLVCIFGTLSFLASIHVFDALVSLFFDKQTILLRMYPIIGSLNIESLNYLVGSLIMTSVLMMVTFRLAFSSPLENYLNMVMSSANMMNEAESELVNTNRSVLDMICESIMDISKVIGQTRDITYNVKSELVNLRPMPEKTEELSAEIEEVKKEIIMLKENFKKQISCPSCGSIILARFKICPYCGESLQLSLKQVIVEKLK